MDWIDMFVLFGGIAPTTDPFPRLLLLFPNLSGIFNGPFISLNPFPLFHVSLLHTIQASFFSPT
jgi:hypothetical protein